MQGLIFMNKKHLLFISFAFLVLLFITDYYSFDILISSFFYKDGTWSGNTNFITVFLRKYGTWFANLTAIISLVLLFIHKKKRKLYTYMILVLLVGSGLVVNVLMKGHWGRPRPRIIKEFNGKENYRSFLRPKFQLKKYTGDYASFPSGHAANGFYLFAFFFMFIYLKKKKLSYLSLSFALVYGVLMSYTRISQGAHFFSDVVCSAYIMYTVSYIFYKRLLNDK
jgi:lipid A 4'-phosphatase